MTTTSAERAANAANALSVATDASDNQTADRRRAELGRFLKACRARRTPQEAGLPPGARRKTPGLRREEVALLAGVGFTWYTWLEQGRPIKASSQVLDAVSRALDMDPTERRHMYDLADATPTRADLATTEIPEQVGAILAGLDPLPAALINSRFDVVATNAAHADMLWQWHTLPCIHKNMLWCHLTEPTSHQKLLNYDDEIPYTVARLRADYGRHVGDPAWEEDIRRLRALSGEFAELWDRHEVAKPEPRVRIFVNQTVGRLTLSVSDLDVAYLPELRIEVYTPADEVTRERLRLTRRPAPHR